MYGSGLLYSGPLQSLGWIIDGAWCSPLKIEKNPHDCALDQQAKNRENSKNEKDRRTKKILYFLRYVLYIFSLHMYSNWKGDFW